MPDLDDELAGLRDTLRASVPVPDVHAVISRSRQRTSRRRRQLGAVAAVLVVGATIPLLRTALRPAPDYGLAPSEPVPSTTYSTEPGHAPPGPFIYDVNFADDKHGFALRASCGPENNAPCTTELLATENGTSWETHRLPSTLGHTTNGGLTSQLVVLGPSTVLVGEIYDRNGPRFWSTDGGRSWQPASMADEPVDTIPDGGPLLFICSDRSKDDCAPKLAVIRPDSGQAALLRTSLPLTRLRACAEFPVNGAWWVAGTNSAGQLELAASRDGGATWKGIVLSDAPSGPFKLSVTAQGSTMYATVTGEAEDRKTGLAAIYRSTDSGARWEQTWKAATGQEPLGIPGAAIPRADGSVLIHAELGQPYLSKDGGKTFAPTKVDDPTPSGFTRLTRAGYLISQVNTSRYWLSADAVNWKPITVG